MPSANHFLPCALGLLLLGVASEASAQAEQAPPPPEPYYEPAPAAAPAAETTREGFLLGASLGFGTLDIGGSSGGTLNYHIELGGFLTPEWAIAVGFWGGDDTDEYASVTNNNAGVMAQYWLRESFWLKGYLGTASLTSEIDGVRYADYEGMSFGGMAGWEFYDNGSYHVHASAGVTFSGYKDIEDNSTATAIQIGLQYY